MTLGLLSKYDVDGLYFICSAKPCKSLIYDVMVATLHTTVVIIQPFNFKNVLTKELSGNFVKIN